MYSYSQFDNTMQVNEKPIRLLRTYLFQLARFERFCSKRNQSRDCILPSTSGQSRRRIRKVFHKHLIHETSWTMILCNGYNFNRFWKKRKKVAFNRIQDRDDVLRECDGLEINGKKDRFINFLESFQTNIPFWSKIYSFCSEIVNLK